MSKNDVIELDGQIVEVLPNQTYKVLVSETETTIMSYTGGRMRQNKIRLVIGDSVRIELSPYDLSKGRLVHRY